MAPSRLTPIFTVIEAPEVGPVPLNTSSRDMFIRTGWPDFFESVSATGSRYTSVLPPKPPPISAGLTLMSPMVMPVSLAVRLRTAKWPWLELQISALPPPSQFARQAWGLDVRLVDRRGLEVLLDDLVGLGETRVEIADLEADLLGDVRRAIGCRVHAARDHVLEQQRRVLGHRLLHVDDVRQHLVVHVNEGERPVRDGGADRGDRGDRVAFVERLLARHDVARDVPEIDREPLGADEFKRVVGQIRTGDHRLHPRQRLGARGVDGADTSMRVGAAQHPSVKHSGQIVIGAELRGPRDLRHTVGTHRPGSDPLEGLLRLRHPGLLACCVKCEMWDASGYCLSGRLYMRGRLRRIAVHNLKTVPDACIRLRGMGSVLRERPV